LAFAVLAVSSAHGSQSRRRVWASVAFIALAATLAVTWKGAEALSEWYGNTRTLEWRFALWRDSLAPLREFYLLGSGLNTYGAVMLFYRQTDLTVHAQQAHNDYLQLAIEGGV